MVIVIIRFHQRPRLSLHHHAGCTCYKVICSLSRQRSWNIAVNSRFEDLMTFNCTLHNSFVFTKIGISGDMRYVYISWKVKDTKMLDWRWYGCYVLRYTLKSQILDILISLLVSISFPHQQQYMRAWHGAIKLRDISHVCVRVDKT